VPEPPPAAARGCGLMFMGLTCGTFRPDTLSDNRPDFLPNSIGLLLIN